jgi:hypothetical protein
MAEITVSDTYRMLQHHLRSRTDLGTWRLVQATIVEPQNPFEPPSMRKPKRWVVLLLVISSALVGTFVYFNFWN